MSGTALTYITSAFTNLNVFQPGATIPAAQSATALTMLNLMMGTWAQQLTPFTIARELFAIVAGKGGPTNPYTWGVGGDFGTPRPVSQNSVTGAAWIQMSATPPVEIPLSLLTDDGWSAIQIKTQPNGQPTSVYYNPTVPYGSVYLWPIPNVAVDLLALYREQVFGPFANLNGTTYTFPDGYDEAIVYNLERRLAGPFGREMPPEDALLARETLANIQRSAQRLSDLPNDFRGQFGRNDHGYNIQTGQ